MEDPSGSGGDGDAEQQEADEAQSQKELMPSLVRAGFKTVLPRELKVLGKLGDGAQAQVFKAEWTRSFGACTSSIIVAVKRMHPTLGVLYRDRELLTLETEHPNLVKCFDCTLEQPYLIVNEYCGGGSLHDLLHNSRQMLTNPQIVKCLMDIASGMSFLHEQSPAILHRDMKSSNVLLMKPIMKSSQMPNAKIADFGLSRASRVADESMMTVGVGTWRWMAPEVFEFEGSDEEEDPYDTRLDVFSFAMVIYECLTRKLPYIDVYPADKADPRIGLSICQGLRPNLKFVRADPPEELVHIMERAWDGDMTQRPLIQECLRQLQSLLQSMKSELMEAAAE